MINTGFQILSSRGPSFPEGPAFGSSPGVRREIVPGHAGALPIAPPCGSSTGAARAAARDKARAVPAHDLDPVVGRARGRADEHPALSFPPSRDHHQPRKGFL